MKALLCVGCSDIVAPYPQPTRWRSCQCGASSVRWRDPGAGLLELRCRGGPEGVRALGFANPFLSSAVDGHGDDAEWRSLHEAVCESIPPNYLFSARKRGCWAVIIRPGETGDVSYVPGEGVTDV